MPILMVSVIMRMLWCVPTRVAIDGNSDTMVKVTADIDVGLLRRKEEDD